MRLHDFSWWQPFIDSHRGVSKIYTRINDLRRCLVFDYWRCYYNVLNLCCTSSGITDTKCSQDEIIVSVTTYDKRLDSVCLAIESVMHGSVKSNKVILWLAEEMRNRPLPKSLKRLQKRGLVIDYCEDIRSFKKLVPTLRKYPEACIVTIDDDQIYEKNMLKYLLDCRKQDAHCIPANEVYRARLNAQGRFRCYSEWHINYPRHDKSFLNFPIGEGGVLYPPGSLDEEVLNGSAFMRLCPKGDDIWFYSMALRNGFPVVKTHTSDVRGCVSIENPEVQATALKIQNCSNGESMNDRQLNAVFDEYHLFELLRSVTSAEHQL